MLVSGERFSRELGRRLLASALILSVCISASVAATRGDDSPDSYSPIVFVPGDAGSQLEAKLDKPARVSYMCDLKSDWYDLWLNLHLWEPLVGFDCSSDNMRLVYNRTSRTTQNSPGVQIRPTNFGSLASVANLDTITWAPKTGYFDTIIKELEKKQKFVPDVHMVGAAYDFRKAPNELDVFFQNLTELIQYHYITNRYQPVTIICHSMGCLNTLYLLNRQTQNWKDVYIRRVVALGAPWHGSFKALSAMLFGDDLGVVLFNKKKLQALQSTFPSLMYLFPREPSFAKERVLVETPSVNYTLTNLDDMFKEANMIDQMDMWHDTRDIAANLSAPNVELWCLYGNGVDTPSQIHFNGPFSAGKYKEINGDGDGTVNIESLQACEHFQAQQPNKPVYTREFPGIDHIDILRKSDVAQFITDYIFGHNDPNQNQTTATHDDDD